MIRLWARRNLHGAGDCSAGTGDSSAIVPDRGGTRHRSIAATARLQSRNHSSNKQVRSLRLDPDSIEPTVLPIIKPVKSELKLMDAPFMLIKDMSRSLRSFC